MKFKKSLFAASLLAMILAAPGCREPLDELCEQSPAVAAGGDFEIKMNLAPATRTVAGEEFTEGDYPCMSVSFAVGDAINLFHTEYNADGAYSSYVDDGQFVVTEVNDGVATLKGYIGADLNPDLKYDWFGIYPYNAETVSPERASINFPTKIKMNPDDPASTLAGTCCPLAGFAKGVSASEVPSILMRQLASVVAVQVNNITDEDLVVNTIEIETSQELISGAFSLDCHLYQQYQADKTMFDTAIYEISDRPLRYDLKTTASSGKKVTVDVGGYVIESFDQAVFYVPVAPVTFMNLGSAMSIRVNDFYKPMTLKPMRQWFISCNDPYNFLNVRHKFESGKANVFSFNYAFSEIESTPCIWPMYGDNGKLLKSKSWFMNGTGITEQLACSASCPATNFDSPFSQYAYIWLQSGGCSGTYRISSVKSVLTTLGMWENDAHMFIIPVRHLDAGKKIVIETALGADATGERAKEGSGGGEAHWFGAPAYFVYEYSTDLGASWKKAEIESEYKYSGDACDANVCLGKTKEQGGNYVKATCLLDKDIDAKSFLFRMRVVNAAFSVTEVNEGRTVGGRTTPYELDIYGEPSTYTGMTTFEILGEGSTYFATASVED